MSNLYVSFEVEKIAEIMHEIWSSWYRHQRDNYTPENIARWELQCETKYSELSKEDKEKDIKQARKIIIGLPTINFIGIIDEMIEEVKTKPEDPRTDAQEAILQELKQRLTK